MTFGEMRNPLREKLGQDAPAIGVWITLADPAVTELVCLLGVDWIVVDMEHGGLGLPDILAHARAAAGSGTAVLTRVPQLSGENLKRALDLGIDGVIVPYVKTAAEVAEAFRFGRFPPDGERGIGGERASHWGLEMGTYLEIANRETMIVPLIETRAAIENIDAILDTPGLEAVFMGPADLSASMGHTGAWEGPGVAEVILDVRQRAEAKGIAAGIIGRSAEDQARRIREGFRMICIGADTGFIASGVKEAMIRLKDARYDHKGL